MVVVVVCIRLIINIIILLPRFSCAIVYYGMTFGAQGLSGNLYLNIFLLTIVEVPSFASTFWLLRKCVGRHTQGSACCIEQREREMVYLTTHSTHFIYGYMVKDHSDSEKGNPLPPHRLLSSINSKGSFICSIPQTG